MASLVNAKLKLPGALNEEQARKLVAMADKAQNLPQGSLQRTRAEMDILGELRRMRGIGKVDIATAFYYLHILSGYTTQAVNAVSTALNTMADLSIMAAQHPREAGHLLTGLREGAADGFRHFRSILQTGYSSHDLDNKIPEVPQTLEIRANEQIANAAAVTLNGTDAANRATLDLGGFTETFATLTINGNAVVDFNGGNVCVPAYLYLDDLLIAGGSTLLIKNWIEFTTFLLVKNTSTNVEGELGRIQFEGYGEAADWLPYDSTWSMIAPVPEPSTYGAIFLTAGLALVAYRRHRATKKAA